MAKTNAPKRNVFLIAALILLCLTLVSMSLMSGMFARYTTKSASNDTGRIAKFRVTGNGFTDAVTFNVKMNPGDSQKKTLSVVNDSEVAVRYTVTVENATDNLPLQVTGTSLTGTLAPGAAPADVTFNLKWPADENDAAYSGMLDNIVVTVTAVQVD